MSNQNVELKPALAMPGAPVSDAGPPKPKRRAIVHPVADFLCLGGASLILLPVLLMTPASAQPALIAVNWMLADALNQPHFAASYQIFYRGYFEKAFGQSLPRDMRIRYVIAGIVVPLAMLAFFAVAFMREDGQLLGWGGNVMLFLVGWHYTKQGYGMLMVDAVYQRRFFNDAEKNMLRYNAYACWFMFWLSANSFVSEYEMWGLEYYSFKVPEWTLWAMGAMAAATTVLTLRIFALRLMPGGAGLPVTGVVAYLTTLYVWLAARFQPVTLMFVPAFHSLQYLLIVLKYESNRARDLNEDATAAGENLNRWHVIRFAIVAVLLGLIGFWWAPKFLEFSISYDREAIGGAAFLFTFWIFINIHHYFMDNVIWRRENPDTARSLFGAGKK